MNQLDTTAITEQIRADFLYNEKAFALNRYAEVLECDVSTLQRYCFSFELPVSHMFGDLERRVRAAAQQTMVHRAAALVDKLLKSPLIELDQVVDKLKTVPPESEVNWVMNPLTLEKFLRMDGAAKDCRPIGIVEEDTVKVSGMRAACIIPDGIALLVSRRQFRGAEKGSMPHAAICHNLTVDMTTIIEIDGQTVSGGVVGLYLPVAQGYCWQIAVDGMVPQFSQ